VQVLSARVEFDESRLGAGSVRKTSEKRCAKPYSRPQTVHLRSTVSPARASASSSASSSLRGSSLFSSAAFVSIASLSLVKSFVTRPGWLHAVLVSSISVFLTEESTHTLPQTKQKRQDCRVVLLHRARTLELADRDLNLVLKGLVECTFVFIEVAFDDFDFSFRELNDRLPIYEICLKPA
jgi:hypothetical protein